MKSENTLRKVWIGGSFLRSWRVGKGYPGSQLNVEGTYRHDITADRGPLSFKTMMASNNGSVCIELVPGAQCEHLLHPLNRQLTDDGPDEREAQHAD